MRKLMLIIMCMWAIKLSAQTIDDLAYKVDTFHCADVVVQLQRYDIKDLNSIYGTRDSKQIELSYDIGKLQTQLDVMKARLVASGTCNADETWLNALRKSKLNFDYTNYENEYNNYIAISRKHENSMAVKQQQYVKQQNTDDSIFKAENPNIISDLDRQLASNYNLVDGAGINNRCGKAWSKIQRIEYMQKKNYQDSLADVSYQRKLIEEKNEEKKRLKELIRKYGEVVGKKLFAEKVWIGMTDKMVIDEFGPADIKRAVTASGVTETWTYTPSSSCAGDGCPVLDYYMVFQQHKLVAIGDL